MLRLVGAVLGLAVAATVRKNRQEMAEVEQQVDEFLEGAEEYFKTVQEKKGQLDPSHLLSVSEPFKGSDGVSMVNLDLRWEIPGVGSVERTVAVPEDLKDLWKNYSLN